MSYLVPPVLNACLNNITYPITYTKTLMQLGHEPLSEFKGRSYGLFGPQVTRLPSAPAYMKHIVQVDGIIGLGRGFGSRIVCDVLFRVVQDRGNAVLASACGLTNEETNSGKVKDEGDISELVKSCAVESCSKLAAIVISQPFYVISIRAMSQFIGRETIYGLPFVSAFKDIYSYEGVTGFFAGIIPRILCEIANLWLGKAIYYLMCNYIFTDDNHQMKTLQPWGRLSTPILTSYFTYPLALTSTIMAVNGSSLRAGNFPFTPVYSSWLACLTDLRLNKETGRGSAFFIRIANR